MAQDTPTEREAARDVIQKMDALEKSTTVRFLRQKYVDPLTGKSDWRLIPVGQNKTTVKGFFGQPLGGLGGGGLGSAGLWPAGFHIL